jgi:hypothetical protein
MTMIPTVPLFDVEAALDGASTTPPPAPSKASQDLAAVLDKPLSPIKFHDGTYVVDDMGLCYRLASHYMNAGMIPRGLEGKNPKETQGRVAIAIEFGQQFKWSPLQSLQSVYVVNGRPMLWGDGPLSLVLSSGLLLDYTAKIEGTGDERVAVFSAVRKIGTAGVINREVRFSVADAKKGGIWGKSGPWSNYPERMLMYRARAFCLRDLFADVLSGIGIAEEHDEFALDAKAEQTAALQEKVAAIEIVKAE